MSEENESEWMTVDSYRAFRLRGTLHDYSTEKIASPIELRRDKGTTGVVFLEERRLICWRSGG